MANSEKAKSGVKFDKHKLRWVLMPWDALTDVVRVFMYGACKYGERNWELGMDRNRLLDAALRHISKYMCGEFEDNETGLNHLAHAVASLLMLIAYEVRGMNFGIPKDSVTMSYGWCQDYDHGGLYKVKPLQEKSK